MGSVCYPSCLSARADGGRVRWLALGNEGREELKQNGRKR